MKGSWISPKVKERNVICNVLLCIVLFPLVLIDIVGLCYTISNLNLQNSILFVDGILAIVSVYGLLIRNKWNGFIIGVSMFFAAIVGAIAGDHNPDAIEEMSRSEIIFNGMLGSTFFTFLAVVPILLVLLIRKNGVSAIQLIEGGGIITKCGIEIIVTIVMCILTMTCW